MLRTEKAFYSEDGLAHCSLLEIIHTKEGSQYELEYHTGTVMMSYFFLLVNGILFQIDPKYTAVLLDSNKHAYCKIKNFKIKGKRWKDLQLFV